MSEPNPMPQSRDEMIRAVCEAQGGNQNSGRCVCIHEDIPPCLAQAGLADDVLAWLAEARAGGIRDAQILRLQRWIRPGDAQ